MVTIEHNPTHIETALPEGRAAHGEGAEIRLDGVTRKKNRKNNGLGAFSKLLAGLVSKKTLKQGENSPNGLGPPGITQNRTKKEAFPRLTEAKGSKLPKSGTSVSKENRQNETPRIQSQSLNELYPINIGLPRIAAAEDMPSKSQSFTFEQVSLKTDNSVPVKEALERRIPFKKGETSGEQLQGNISNVSIQSKKEEKLPSTAGTADGTDTKKAGRKRNSFSVEVHDLRTQTGAEAGMVAERGLKGTEEMRNNPEKEITVDLRPAGGRSEKPAEVGQKAPDGENFEQILARELRGDLSADIVKQAAIVLRDGGEGTIKLALKPETLGKVKIHLEMAENRVSGLIFVDNEEALRAFEQEIHTLEQFFRDSGFEASLNAALDQRDGGQRWKEKEVEPFFSGRFAASYEGSGSMELSGGFSAGFGINAVNVLV